MEKENRLHLPAQIFNMEKVMADNHEFTALPAEEGSDAIGFDGAATLSQPAADMHLTELETKMDSESYAIGEVPQAFLADPRAYMTLNSERLNQATNMIDKLLDDVNSLITQEVGEIQKIQKQISAWEDRIEKNRGLIAEHQAVVRKNFAEMDFDKKNRDYWWSRSETVDTDLQHALASARKNDWAWLIKKYGLKNADGSEIDCDIACVEELAEGAAKNLVAEYRNAGNKYETAKKDKETANTRLVRENGRMMNTNETLQGYISAAYSQKIEPIQDGILLMKEVAVKLKGLDGSSATFGQLRAWAEPFLDEFLRNNHRVSQAMVTEFRKLASIPLPAQNS
jgi:cell division septum initiation protein DivIVA